MRRKGARDPWQMQPCRSMLFFVSLAKLQVLRHFGVEHLVAVETLDVVGPEVVLKEL